MLGEQTTTTSFTSSSIHYPFCSSTLFDVSEKSRNSYLNIYWRLYDNQFFWIPKKNIYDCDDTSAEAAQVTWFYNRLVPITFQHSKYKHTLLIEWVKGYIWRFTFTVKAWIHVSGWITTNVEKYCVANSIILYYNGLIINNGS